jgi:hypothetical protein
MKIIKNNPILKNITNSAIKAWNGEEKLWKVFWLWGVFLYGSCCFCVISFGNGFLKSLEYGKLEKLNILMTIFVLFYSIFIFLCAFTLTFIYPIIFLIALNRCCHDEFSKVVIKLFAIIPIFTLFIIIEDGDANMFNEFKKGFYFEKYKTAEEAKTVLLKLHPIGSDVEGLVKTLERAAGRKCGIYREETESYDFISDSSGEKGVGKRRLVTKREIVSDSKLDHFSCGYREYYLFGCDVDWSVTTNVNSGDNNKISTIAVELNENPLC